MGSAVSAVSVAFIISVESDRYVNSLDLMLISAIRWDGVIRCAVQEDPIEEALHKVINTMRRAYAVNPNLDFEVFIHKVSVIAGDFLWVLFLSRTLSFSCSFAAPLFLD